MAVTSQPALILLKPARVFDGEAMHEGWVVLVRGGRIEAAGPAATVSTQGAAVVDLPGTTLLPGLIEAHSHVLLHPYNETSWNDQVAHEPLALRIARATTVAESDAGCRASRRFAISALRAPATRTSGLKQAVQQNIIPGPRMLVVTRAIVATGTYGPKGFPAEWLVPQGAEEADGRNADSRRFAIRRERAPTGSRSTATTEPGRMAKRCRRSLRTR